MYVRASALGSSAVHAALTPLTYIFPPNLEHMIELGKGGIITIHELDSCEKEIHPC